VANNDAKSFVGWSLCANSTGCGVRRRITFNAAASTGMEFLPVAEP